MAINWWGIFSWRNNTYLVAHSCNFPYLLYRASSHMNRCPLILGCPKIGPLAHDIHRTLQLLSILIHPIMCIVWAIRSTCASLASWCLGEDMHWEGGIAISYSVTHYYDSEYHIGGSKLVWWVPFAMKWPVTYMWLVYLRWKNIK